MMPSSHKPARFFTSEKTHKFEIFDININKLKLQPIIDQTETCYYKMGSYCTISQTLTKNEFGINNTQKSTVKLNRVFFPCWFCQAHSLGCGFAR